MVTTPVQLLEQVMNAEGAEIVGTAVSSTSHTEDIKHGYMFLVGYDEEGIYIDTFVEITPALNGYARMATAKLLDRRDDELESALLLVKYIELRSRFTSGNGPYLVKTSFPLDYEALLRYLTSLSIEDRKDFLHRSRV